MTVIKFPKGDPYDDLAAQVRDTTKAAIASPTKPKLAAMEEAVKKATDELLKVETAAADKEIVELVMALKYPIERLAMLSVVHRLIGQRDRLAFALRQRDIED